jgi:hypothetical protein
LTTRSSTSYAGWWNKAWAATHPGRSICRPHCRGYVQAGVAMPAWARARASAAAQYGGIRVDLEPRELAALVLEMDLQLPSDQSDPPAVSVERADHAMLEVYVRLLGMLDRPCDLPVLG